MDTSLDSRSRFFRSYTREPATTDLAIVSGRPGSVLSSTASESERERERERDSQNDRAIDGPAARAPSLSSNRIFTLMFTARVYVTDERKTV